MRQSFEFDSRPLIAFLSAVLDNPNDSILSRQESDKLKRLLTRHCRDFTALNAWIPQPESSQPESSQPESSQPKRATLGETKQVYVESKRTASSSQAANTAKAKPSAVALTNIELLDIRTFVETKFIEFLAPHLKTQQNIDILESLVPPTSTPEQFQQQQQARNSARKIVMVAGAEDMLDLFELPHKLVPGASSSKNELILKAYKQAIRRELTNARAKLNGSAISASNNAKSATTSPTQSSTAHVFAKLGTGTSLNEQHVKKDNSEADLIDLLERLPVPSAPPREPAGDNVKKKKKGKKNSVLPPQPHPQSMALSTGQKM